jgi:hypothetical protein
MIDDKMTDNAIAAHIEGISSLEYYAYFNQMTNGGIVMTNDLSGNTIMALTEDEILEREQYTNTIATLAEYYRNRSSPIVATKNDVLCQRIVAPTLESGAVSARSVASETRAGREYLNGILGWSEFSDLVNGYYIEMEQELPNPGEVSSIFCSSLDRASSNNANESEEQSNLLYNLRNTLVRSGIVHKIQTTFPVGVTHGRVDFCLMKDDSTISIVCETKSTHNSQLPMEAQLCVEKYNTAYRTMEESMIRTTEWSNTAHPLDQLICYMVDNNRRYGALTSGTRTYFLCARNDEDASEIMMSDAWFVGQENYLRAWAYVHSLGCRSNSKWLPPKKRFRSTNTIDTPNLFRKVFGRKLYNTRSRSSSAIHGAGKRHKTDHCYDILQQLPHISIDDVEIVSVLGSGRNGSCFRVNWKGQELAMKQFDVGRDGNDHYAKEIVAYSLLYDGWGILVPRPIFLSQSTSGGRVYLALQLGREPNEKDDISGFDNVLDRLKTEYGIRHNDADGRNMIFIPDSNGGERIVAIDFEDWNFDV